jgi:hypothetical protein
LMVRASENRFIVFTRFFFRKGERRAYLDRGDSHSSPFIFFSRKNRHKTRSFALGWRFGSEHRGERIQLRGRGVHSLDPDSLGTVRIERSPRRERKREVGRAGCPRQRNGRLLAVVHRIA